MGERDRREGSIEKGRALSVQPARDEETAADRVDQVAQAGDPGAAGAFVGLYAFRSYLRIVLLARGRPRIAGLSHLVYAVCGRLLVARWLNGEGTALLDRSVTALALAHANAIAVTHGALRQRIRSSVTTAARTRQ
ncbi:hypothetical protein SB2_30615, partial [Methylobacterium radiotolerans]